MHCGGFILGTAAPFLAPVSETVEAEDAFLAANKPQARIAPLLGAGAQDNAQCMRLIGSCLESHHIQDDTRQESHVLERKKSFSTSAIGSASSAWPGPAFCASTSKVSASVQQLQSQNARLCQPSLALRCRTRLAASFTGFAVVDIRLHHDVSYQMRRCRLWEAVGRVAHWFLCTLPRPLNCAVPRHEPPGKTKAGA